MSTTDMKSYFDFYIAYLAAPRKRLYCDGEDQRREYVRITQERIDMTTEEDPALRLFLRKLDKATTTLPRPFEDVLADHGYTDAIELMEAVIGRDENAPTLCEEGCEVEPDGMCCHGHKSVLILLGVI